MGANIRSFRCRWTVLLSVVIQAVVAVIPVSALQAGDDPLAAYLPTTASQRLPVPSKDELDSSLRVVQQVFGGILAKARTPQTRVQAAQTLLAKANEGLAQDDPAGTYALLQIAREHAWLAGDWELAFAAIDAQARDFECEAITTKLALLEEMTGKPKSLLKPEQVTPAALRLTDQAIEQERFTQAAETLELAAAVAQKAKLTETVKLILARQSQIKHLQQSWLDARSAAKKLIDEPDNAEAHQQVGEYLSFVRNEWVAGLAHLAAGSDLKLKQMAELELKPDLTPTEQLSLADQWWDLSKAHAGVTQQHIREHALDWYLIVQPELKGLTLARVEQLLSENLSLANSAIPIPLEGISLLTVPVLSRQGADVQFSQEADQNRGTVQMAGKTYAEWIFAHPGEKAPTAIRFDLRKHRGQLFSAVVGIKGGGNLPKSPQIFEVWGNNKLLWKSPPLLKPDQTEDCAVKITGVTALELRTYSQGSTAFAWCLWGNPRVMKK